MKRAAPVKWNRRSATIDFLAVRDAVLAGRGMAPIDRALVERILPGFVDLVEKGEPNLSQLDPPKPGKTGQKGAGRQSP